MEYRAHDLEIDLDLVDFYPGKYVLSIFFLKFKAFIPRKTGRSKKYVSVDFVIVQSNTNLTRW